MMWDDGEDGPSRPKYPYPKFSKWKVYKYKSEFPPEHWELCRLFMVANKTKYPETRLAQLTVAFFDMGVHGRRTDPKTNRMVAALSIPLIEHLLHSNPGAMNHPFMRRVVENAIDSGQGVKPGSGAENRKREDNNSTQRDYLERAGPAEPKQEPSAESSVASSNSLESKQYPLEGSAGSFESQLNLFKNQTCFPTEEHQPTTQEQQFSTQKRVSAELKLGPDQNRDTSDQKLEVPESKRRRLYLNDSPPDNKASDEVAEPGNKASDKGAEQYTITKMLDNTRLRRLLKGLIIVRGVTKESTLNTDDVSVVEDSFKCSKYGPCAWDIAKVNESRGVIRVSLLSRGEVIVEAEGQNKEFLQRKIAGTLISRLATLSPIIKAVQGYYNDGKYRKLPSETTSRNHVSQFGYSSDRLKRIIDDYSLKEDFLELVALHFGDSPDEFRIQDIIEFIEKEKADKLKYRLANFLYRGKSYPAICVSQIHDGQDLFQWLRAHKDERYSVGVCSKSNLELWKYPRDICKSSGTTSANGKNENGENSQMTNRNSASRDTDTAQSNSRPSEKYIKSDTKSGPQNSHQDKVDLNKNGSSQSQSTPKHEGSSIINSSAREVQLSQMERSQPATMTKPLVAPALASTSFNAGNKEELSWVGKEHLSAVGKSIYLVKFVKTDSTTDKDPFNLLNSTCSLAFNIEMKYVMKHRDDKQWHVLVVLKHDGGNILVGEATAGTCAEARLAATQDAVNTIQAYCRVVEPNFKYFAEGGEPTFISLKNPMKTSTYEIMNMNTSKTSLTQPVVNILLEMFIKDTSVEDLFFLASDFTSEERECICKTSIQYGLGWRLFGQRSRASSEGDFVSTQHVCVFRPKSARELVQQLIVSGGSTDKYSIVTRPNATSFQSVWSGPPPVQPPVQPPATPTTALIEICAYEDVPGGCCDPNCSLAHQNIIDSVVNKFLKIR